MNSGGLLWVVPFVFLSLQRIKSRKLERFWRLIWIAPLIYLVIVSALAPTVRGVHWGPRFVLEALPFLLIVGTIRAQRWWKRYPITKPIIILLIATSIINQFYSYDTLREQRKENADLNRWAASTGSEPALTSIGWLAGDVALLSDRFPWYLTDKKSYIQFVVNELRKRDVVRFNFYERPPYYDSNFWWSVGAEHFGEDYFLEGDGRLRRCWFKILR